MISKSTEASVAIAIPPLSNLLIVLESLPNAFHKIQNDHTTVHRALLKNTDKCLNPTVRFCSAELLARFHWHLQTPKPTYTETFKEQEPLKIHLHFPFSSSSVSIRTSKSVTKALNVKMPFNNENY